MNKLDTPMTMPRSRSAMTECCADPDCGSGLRNNYYDGKRLTPDTFRVEHRYLVERRRLLNRAIHGSGVVYGYGISLDPPRDERRAPMVRRLAVAAGLALDECGRELIELGTDRIELADLIVVDDKGRLIDRETAFGSADHIRLKEGDASRFCWQLSVHYAEQDRDPVPITDPCGCREREWDHVCETVRYTLQLIPCKDCCRDHGCELTCECGSHQCCHSQHDATLSPDAQWRKEVLPGRGGCGCLCDHLTNLNPGDACDTRLCEIDEQCGRVRVDLRHGVPLACVKVTRDHCGDWTIGGDVDGCGPRRLVKRNDLLFDLIRGCDLTRITEIGWKDWHRQDYPVDFDKFSAAFGDKGEGQVEYVTRDFSVTFSRPVRWETVLADCFTMTVLSGEQDGGWWKPFRVPIIRVETDGNPAEMDDGHPKYVRKATIVVDGDWVEDALRGAKRLFKRGETRIEIEVRGDFIIDCNGQPVDANAIGRSSARTGNGTPGGTFTSGFTVAAPDPRDSTDKHENKDRLKGALL